jgi:hypothetical protein
VKLPLPSDFHHHQDFEMRPNLSQSHCVTVPIRIRCDFLHSYVNSADELMPDFERIRVLLNSDGRLHWEPGGIFRTTCDIDIAYFPFDSQVCPLLIGAYSYYSTRMNITNASSTISTHDFRINGEWHVASTSARWGITVLQTPGDSKSGDFKQNFQQLVNQTSDVDYNGTDLLFNYTGLQQW